MSTNNSGQNQRQKTADEYRAEAEYCRRQYEVKANEYRAGSTRAFESKSTDVSRNY